MGRNKIKIERITNERTRLATLNKRKNGLVKKAMELAILCNCEVALIVIGNNKLTQYSSSDMDQLLLRYTEGGFEEPHPDPLTNDDYPRLFGKKNKGSSSSSGGQLSSGSLHSGSGLKESPAKRQRTESPTPGASDSPITQLSDGRTSPTAVPTLMPRGPSPVTTAGGRPVSPAAAPGGAAHPASSRMAAPPHQPPPMAYAGSYERYLPAGAYPSNGPNRSAVFPPSHQPSSSPSPSRSSLPSSLYSVPPHLAAVPGRLSPSHPHMQRHGSAGSPMLEGARPQSPHSNPTTPPGSGGHFAAAAAAAAAEADVRSRAAGRMHQEQQFTQKLNKKNLSLAIPDASSSSSSGGASYPGSSSAGQASRHTTYTPGFTALGVPSHMPFLGAAAEHDGMQHSGALPSLSAFFPGETPGSHPSAEHGPYSAAGLLPHGGWGSQQQHQGGSWLSSSPLPDQRLMALHEQQQQQQQASFLPTARFLSRDLNMALEGHCTPTVDGALHQLGLTTSKPPAGYAAAGDKRKACELRKA